MSGENVRLEGNQERVLRALLVEPTFKRVADKSGVSERQIYRYLNDETFKSALKDAQAGALELAVARLGGLLQRALDVLGEDMTQLTFDRRLRQKASEIVLRHHVALLEFASLEQRVAELEKARQ